MSASAAAAMADQHESPTNLEDLTPEEASRIIHSHRKVRYGMSLNFSLCLKVFSLLNRGYQWLITTWPGPPNWSYMWLAFEIAAHRH